MNDVTAWLDSLGLSRYAQVFADNDIDTDILPELSDQDLKDLGISLGHRKKLLKAIAALAVGSSDGMAFGAASVNHLGQSPATPQSYTPDHLAEKILAARSTLEGERKQVTVLFADIKGSTELVERLDPEHANQLLDPVLRAMMEAVHRFEGTVNKVQGDGLMALFGAPLAHEDHAVRACYAALAMQQSVAALGAEIAEPVQIRVGLHSGEVVVRGIGNDLSMNYDAVGVTVHLAARLEQNAPAGAIYLSADTLRLAEGLIEVSEQGPIPLKGVHEPVAVYQLQRTTAARTRWQATLGRGLSRFVGRAEALSSLRRSLARALQGRGQIAAIVGEPGVGKSRLVYEFARSLAPDAWQVVAGSSVSYGKASNWLPVIDLCRSYFGIDEDDSSDRMADKVLRRLEELDPAFAPHLPPFLALLQLPVNDTDWQALGALQQRRRTLDALKALFVRESQRQPLLLIFEDLHWIDGETQALLDELVDQLPSQRILLLTNYRPEYSHGWTNKSYYEQLRLSPLEQANARELLGDLLGVDPGLDHLKAALIKHTAGNPLFLEESVRSLVETGTLAGQAGAYCVVGDVGALTLPMTLQALIAQRIDRLAPGEKRLLQTAAVIGTHSPLRVLQRVSERPGDDLQRGLGVLQAAEFLYPGELFPEPEYRFKHAHTHEVAYAGLLKEQRRELHARTAQALQQLYPERRSELAEKLAEHCERGELWSSAIEHYLLSAAKGKSNYTYATASAYARKALRLSEERSDAQASRIEALTQLGDLASLMGELDPANAYYEQALTLVETGERHRRIANRVHRRRFAQREGAKIAFYEHGSAEQTLLLVRAVAYHVAMFQPVVEDLCQDFRVVTIDPRGTGASDPVPETYPMRQYVEDVRAVIEEMDRGPVVAVGISDGGLHLAWLARRHPDLLEKLVFVGTMPALDYEGPGWSHWGQAFGRGDFSRFDEFLTAFTQRLFPEPESRDFALDYIRMAKQLPQEVWRNFMASEPDYDIRPILNELQMPTLVLHGAIDRQVPFECALEIARRVPSAELYAFEGKGHHVMFTASQEFCKVLRQFVLTGSVPHPNSEDSQGVGMFADG